MHHTFSPAVLATISGPIVTCPIRAAEIMDRLRAAASGRSSLCTVTTVARRGDYDAFVADFTAYVDSDGGPSVD
jgi:hypothetical protein